MKKTLLFLLLIPVLGVSQEAPNLTWKRIYGGKKSETAHDVISTYVGQIVVVGETESPPAEKTDGLMLLLGPQGDTVFERRYGGEGDDVIKAVVQTYDGNFVLAGHTNSLGNGKKDGWLLKVNGKGDTLWQKVIGGPGDDTFEDIMQTTDGYLVAVGATSDNGREDTWVYKAYDDGEEVWKQTYGSRGFDMATAVTEGMDGNYGIAGITSAGKGSRNIWLFILSKDAKPLAHQIFGTRQWEEVNSVVATADGGYAMAGYAKTVVQNKGSGFNDMWVIKTDAEAQEIWQKTYGGNGNDYAFDLIETPDNGLVIAGHTYSHLIGANRPAAMLIKVNGRDGRLIWEKKPPFGGSGTDKLEALVLMPDGGLVLAGQTDSKQEDARSQDIWVLRLVPEHVPTTTLPTELKLKDLKITGIRKGVLTENDEAALVFTLENTGNLDAFDVRIDIYEKAGVSEVSYPVGVLVGFLGAGRSKKFNLPLRAKKITKVSTARLNIRYSDASRTPFVTQEIDVTVQPAEIPPNFLQIEWDNPSLEDYPEQKMDVKLERFSVRVLARCDKPLKRGNFTIMLNGEPYKVGQKSGEASLRSTKNNQQDASGMYLYTYSNILTLPLGDNTVEVVVENDTKKESTGVFRINYNDKPNLHIIALGIQHDDLLYTTKDAEDFAASFQGQDGKVFDKVYMRKLVSGDTTRAGEVQTNGDVIKQAFADLKEKYNYTIYDRDFLVLFISSHGRSVNSSFKIVPTDFDMVGEKALIDFQDDVIEQIDRISCNKLIFIDACQSGSIASNDSLPPGQEALTPEELEKAKAKEQERLRAQAKAIVEQGKAAATTSTLASCNANESSWEDKIWGNGAFTEAIIGAFHNEAYKDDNGVFRPTEDDDIITLRELVDYLNRRVPQMIIDAGKNGTQHPYIDQSQLELVKNIELFEVSK